MNGPQSLAASAACAVIGVVGVIRARKMLAPAPASASGVERADTTGLSASASLLHHRHSAAHIAIGASHHRCYSRSLAAHSRAAFARTALLLRHVAGRAAEQRY